MSDKFKSFEKNESKEPLDDQKKTPIRNLLNPSYIGTRIIKESRKDGYKDRMNSLERPKQKRVFKNFLFTNYFVNVFSNKCF